MRLFGRISKRGLLICKIGVICNPIHLMGQWNILRLGQIALFLRERKSYLQRQNKITNMGRYETEPLIKMSLYNSLVSLIILHLINKSLIRISP